MARPPKSGLDYYSMDVGFLRDKKIRLLRSEFGASSVLFVLYVLGKVYEEEGYFLTWDKDERLLAADELRETSGYVDEVLQGCLRRLLFDEQVFQMFGVLTSPGIQRRYLRGCEKRDSITMIREYWLLDLESKLDTPAKIRQKLWFISLSEEETGVSSPGNPFSDVVSSPGNPQSKGKESKVKKEREGGAGAPAPVTVEEAAEYGRSIGSPVDAQTWFDYYAARGWRMGKSPMRDWQAAFRAAGTWEQWNKNGRGDLKAPADYEDEESFV